MKSYEYTITLNEAKLKNIISKIYDELMWPNVEKNAKKTLGDDFISKKTFIEIFLEEKTLKQVLDSKFELHNRDFIKTLDEVLMNHINFKSLDKIELQREILIKILQEQEYERTKAERELGLVRSLEALGYTVTKKNGD